MRPGVQIGPTASQGQHTVRRARFPFVRARRPADVNRQGMALHLALRVGSARDPKRNEPFKAALSQFLVARLAEARSHETTIGA
jgi:5-carboxymethyl-2-hydroxymuconate isomerase